LKTKFSITLDAYDAQLLEKTISIGCLLRGSHRRYLLRWIIRAVCADDQNVTFELSEGVWARLTALAETHGMTLDELFGECVEKGLPNLEHEVLGEQFVERRNRGD